MNKEGFQQYPDQIPYKRISNFELLQVLYADQTFSIKLTTKFQNLPEDKQFIIKRKLSDFRWLLSKLEQESPWILVIPTIFDLNWSIHALITDQTKSSLKKWHQENYLLNGVIRFLKILKSLTLKFMYKPGFFKSSLFVFLDKNYQLYRLFQKIEENSTIQMQNLVNRGTNIYKMLLNKGKKMISLIYNQENPNEMLQIYARKLSEIGQFVKKISQDNRDLMKNLQVLCSNFLAGQKNIKKKEAELYTIDLKLEYLAKTISQVLRQINEISTKFEVMSLRQDNQLSIKQQIVDYKQFIEHEVKNFEKEIEKISDEFFNQCFQNTVSINIQDIEPC